MAPDTQLEVDLDEPEIIPVLLAGGRGQRLWPLSRASHPKPFIKVMNKASLFEKTWQRIERFNDFIICGNIHHHKIITSQIPKSKSKGTQIILEPCSKGTAPAITMAAHYLQRTKPNAVMCIMPTDHFISDAESFTEDLIQAAHYAAGSQIVSMVFPPTSPSQRYGYFKIQQDINSDERIYKSSEFIEKPSKDVAANMIKEGNALWNTGIILARPNDLLEALKLVDQQILEQAHSALNYAGRANSAIVVQDSYFDPIRFASIDKALLENLDNLSVYPLRTAWRDNGTWGGFLRSALFGS